MTSCDRLPDIVRYGGLLSYRERIRLGIAEPAVPHYWGSADKKDALADYVICSFMPPWWMCKKRTEELAMVLLDATAACCHPSARFCPVNSALSVLTAAEIISRRGLEAFDDCFENPTTYQARNSEIFVRDAIPLAVFRAVIFCDEEAMAYWREKMNEAYLGAQPRPQVPDQPIQVTIRGTAGFYFPGNWSPQVRLRDD